MSLHLNGSRSASRVAVADREAAAAAEQALKAGVKADAFVAQFIAMTPAEVIAYVNANVTTVAGARALLGKMGMMLLLLARREYRD